MTGEQWLCVVEISKFGGNSEKDDHVTSSVTCRKESQAIIRTLFQIVQNACDGKTRCNDDARVQRIMATECGNNITDYVAIRYNCTADGNLYPIDVSVAILKMGILSTNRNSKLLMTKSTLA